MDEFGQFRCHLALEIRAETGQPSVETGVQADDIANAAGAVALLYRAAGMDLGDALGHDLRFADIGLTGSQCIGI